MHGCAAGSLLLVNAGVDSMGGVIDGGVEISSAPSDLEKTQAELRETFNAAEKFRRELEFLQKGGDPLDLKVGTTASVSLQSTSQFVTSEVAVTVSPHGDSVESSGRLGAEPNSADNLMLFDGDNKFREIERKSLITTSEHNVKESSESVALELPKKSYERRIRSRPNCDGARSSPNSKPKSPNGALTFKNLSSNIKSNGIQTHKSTLAPSQHLQDNLFDQPLTSDTRESLGHVEHESSLSGQKKSLDSKPSCSQTGQSLDGNNNKIEVPNSNGTMELNLASKSMEGNDLNTKNSDNPNPCPPKNNEIGSTLKEDEGLKDGCITSEKERKPCTVLGSDSTSINVCTESDRPLGTSDGNLFQESTLSLRSSIDGSEQNTCSEKDLKLATKEHEDSILAEAQIIEEKRKRIAGLSVGILKPESHQRSHWHFVLEEMSWLANDFAQERLWKVTAAAQISQKAVYSSRVRSQKLNSIWKQKKVAHTLAEAVMEFWHTVQVKGHKKDSVVQLHQYGMRFLEYNSSNVYTSAQSPVTPDRISDLDNILWEDNLTEENLFYIVPPGAIEAYRKVIESHLLQCERTGSSMQEELEVNGYDAVADNNNALEEDEGETSAYYIPGGFSRSTRPGQKKKKPYKTYETGADTSFQPSQPSGKRPASSINVSIPTKRVRTASRPRFSGFIQAPNRADASSGDTNSFQEEQSCGYQIQNNMEAESVGDYEKFDMTEVSNRPKKKKKGSTFENRWQLDSNFQNDQSKRRLDTRQFDSNGNSAVGSQMSNMSNPNKFMKLLVRDRARKAKSLKTPSGQQGSGSPWSLFEDQALVVLVHDMGANWELISDAINSTLQFKCISRNSKECKERHKVLMDRNSGDGADSADDSESSQPYPSTLPGIPEGSARQLFQRLQGPMEEDTLKSHFEKIIIISRKQLFNKSQKDNQDPKQLQQPHGSHALSLSQVCPNNLNGGPVLTPLDLCEPVSSPPEFLPVAYQLPHTSGVPVVSGGHLAPATAPLSPSVRDGRYTIHRTENQNRIQQYNQMMSARNMQQPDRGGGVPIGVMNRGMPMVRPPPPGVAAAAAVVSQGGSGTTRGIPAYPTGMAPFPNQNPNHHLQGPLNTQHLRLMKERQLQQRLRQQQQFATSNPVLPRGQQPQLPTSQIGTPAPPGGSPTVKVQRRPFEQAAGKVMKRNIPVESNGLVQSGGPSGFVQRRFTDISSNSNSNSNHHSKLPQQLTPAQRLAHNRKPNPSPLPVSDSSGKVSPPESASAEPPPPPGATTLT